MDAYSSIARYYDLEHDDFTDDIAWYLHLAEVAGPRVLELGCGSGRLLAPLAAAGNHVVGLDSSAAMLQRAAARLHSAVARGEVSLVQGDMANYSETANGPYDLIILPLNGLLHVDDSDAQRQVLIEAAGTLRRGGFLALDVLHAIPDALTAFDGRVMYEGTWEEDESVVAKFSARTIDWTNQQIATEVWYDDTASNGELKRHRTEFEMRWVTPAEISLMLEIAGFAEWSMAGGYDGSSLSDMSDRLLVVARTAEAS